MLPEVPDALARELRAYTWLRVTLGRSGAAVYHLTKGQEILFLKVAREQEILAGEVARLRWLRGRSAGKFAVPDVLEFIRDGKHAYLLTSGVAGRDASHRSHGGDIEKAAKLLAGGMRTLHALPAQGCPFDHGLDAELTRLRLRLEHQPNAQGVIAKLNELEKRRPTVKNPAQDDLVITHGDYCLPNVMIHEGRLSGFVDLGLAGLGDPYRDLERAAWSLAYNWGERWVPALFEAYGVVPDEERLAFYRALEGLRG